MGKVENTTMFNIRKCLLVAVIPLNMTLPQTKLPCDDLSIWILPSYEFSLLYTLMFLHLCILTPFGVHESSVSWLKPLSCLLLFRGKPFFFYFLHQTIMYILSSCPLSFWPNAQIFLKKQIILVPFRNYWCRTHYCLPFDRSLPIDFNTLFRKNTRKHFSALVLADISGRSPCLWSGVLIIGS